MRKLVDLVHDSDDKPEDYTPIDGSGTYPMWQTAARETAEQLEKMESVEASILAGECRWYQETIAVWSPKNRPSDATRKRIVQELIALLSKAQKTLKNPKFIN